MAKRRKKRKKRTKPPRWLVIFCQNLRRTRRRLKVSQRQLAARTGLFYQNISALERLTLFGLGYGTAARLAEGLGVSLDGLMGLKKPKPRPGKATRMPHQTRVTKEIADEV